jgi:hypothetical protein
LKKVRIDEAYLQHLGAGMIATEPIIEQGDELKLLCVPTRYDGDDRHFNTLGQGLNELWFQFISVLDRKFTNNEPTEAQLGQL